jgi:recombination protein RecT
MSNLANVQSINRYLELPDVVTRLSEKLGHEEAMKFKTALSSAISSNPKILECEPKSILNAALIGHSLNLPPSPQLGYYYLVPYKNRKLKCTEAQFQIGYKGYIQLAMRSGYYKKMNVSDVKNGEFISWNPLTEDLQVNFMTDPLEREKAETVGYCGYFEYNNGFTKIRYWTHEAMEVHADKYSMAYSLATDKLFKAGKIPQKDLWKCSSFWYKDFPVMALKTVIREMLSKWGIMSVEMQTAYEHDVKTEYLPFGEAKQLAEAEIKDEAGSQEVEAQFEEQTPEPADTEEPENKRGFLTDD